MYTLIEKHHDELIDLCRRYHVTELDIFGSAITDDFDPDRSDLDFLVRFDEAVDADRFDCFFGLRTALEMLFGRPVDLVEMEGLQNPYFIEAVNRTRRTLYAAS